jgi:hypothetical protein
MRGRREEKWSSEGRRRGKEEKGGRIDTRYTTIHTHLPFIK